MSLKLEDHPLIQEDRIVLKDKDYRPSGGFFNEESIKRLEHEVDEAAALQESLGLGKVAMTSVESLKFAATESRQVKILDKILRENPSFRVVELPEATVLPRFTRKNGNQMEEESRTRFDTPPLLIVTKLDGTDSIRCSGNSKDFVANVPLIPLEGLKKLKPILDQDRNIEVHLAMMPSWEEAPQRDPILMVKLAGEYVAVHSWGGDVELLQEYIIKKQ